MAHQVSNGCYTEHGQFKEVPGLSSPFPTLRKLLSASRVLSVLYDRGGNRCMIYPHGRQRTASAPAEAPAAPTRSTNNPSSMVSGQLSASTGVASLHGDGDVCKLPRMQQENVELWSHELGTLVCRLPISLLFS